MSQQYPRTTLFGTEERTLFCSTPGREHHLSVALPDGYSSSTQAYPVIYVLDGDFIFGMAAGLTRFSNWFRGVPEAIIVGIGYGMDSVDEWASSGFFVLYALFHQPDAFQRYISGSGDLNIAYSWLIQHDAKLAARDATSPIHLYLSAGELDHDQFTTSINWLPFWSRGATPV
jgi:uncharacterized protein